MCSQISFSTDMSKNVLKTILASNIKRYPLKLKVQMLRYCQKSPSSFSSLWPEIICCNEYTMIASDIEMRHNNLQECLIHAGCQEIYITDLVTSLIETSESGLYRSLLKLQHTCIFVNCL